MLLMVPLPLVEPAVLPPAEPVPLVELMAPPEPLVLLMLPPVLAEAESELMLLPPLPPAAPASPPEVLPEVLPLPLLLLQAFNISDVLRARTARYTCCFFIK